MISGLLKIIEKQLKFMTSYHLKYNGFNEKMNRMLVDMLFIYTNTQKYLTYKVIKYL